MGKILRLLEDYYAAPNDPRPKLNKRNLLMKLAAPKDGWVLVKEVRDLETPPTWIPLRCVITAQPGFYRAIGEMNNRFGNKRVLKGEVVEVTATKRSSLGVLACLTNTRWKIKTLDGRMNTLLCPPRMLEPVVDDLMHPPTRAHDSATSGEASSSDLVDIYSLLLQASSPPHADDTKDCSHEKTTAS